MAMMAMDVTGLKGCAEWRGGRAAQQDSRLEGLDWEESVRFPIRLSPSGLMARRCLLSALRHFKSRRATAGQLQHLSAPLYSLTQ